MNRKIPQSLYAHSLEPSKFWEMSHTDPTVLFPQPMPSLRDPLPPKWAGGRSNQVNMNTSTSMDNSLHSGNSNYGKSGLRPTDKRLLRSSVFLNYADSNEWIDRLSNLNSDGNESSLFDIARNDTSFYGAAERAAERGGAGIATVDSAERPSRGGRVTDRQRSRSAPPRSSSAASFLTPKEDYSFLVDGAKDRSSHSSSNSLATYMSARQTPSTPSQPQSLSRLLKPSALVAVDYASATSTPAHSLRRQFPQARQASASCPFAIDSITTGPAAR